MPQHRELVSDGEHTHLPRAPPFVLRDELLGEPPRGQLGAEGGQQASFQDAAILSERAFVFLGLYWR